MPTTPDQDGTFFNSVGIQRPRTGPVGVPRTGGMAAPTSVPPRPPAVPGAGAQPGGRPPATGPAGSGVGAAASPAPAAPQVQINMPGAPTTPGAPTPAAEAAPGAAGAPSGMPGAAMLPKMPTRRELANYPPGTQIETPYGPVTTNPATGRRSVRLTPEGQMLYARDQQAMRSKMAPNPFNADPNAPKPEVVPGRLFFDPFGGGYVS